MDREQVLAYARGMTFSRFVPTALLAMSSLVTLACADDVVSVDDVGSIDDGEQTTTEGTDYTTDIGETTDATESSTDSTGETTDTATDTSTDTGTDTTGGQDCSAPVADIDFALIGELSPPDGCQDFTFTGQLVTETPGVYQLDACPCGAQCLVPDPYTLTVNLPDAALLPNMPACPIIFFRRDPETCEPASVVVRDGMQDLGPGWAASHQDHAPVDLPAIEVTPVDMTACIDMDLYALAFFSGGDGIAVSQGEQGILPTDDGDWTVKNYASLDAPGGASFAWVGKR